MQNLAISIWSAPMCNRFLKFIPSEEAMWLLDNKPNAFRLLTHIANTARRQNGHPDGLSIGQCHLQHWKKYNFTQQEYRTAKDILVQRKHIEIVETNRTRKKSTTGTTTASTLVKLISSTVYDINSDDINDRINDRATTEQRLSNDKQEGIRISSSNEEDIEIAQRATRLRSRKDLLFYDFEKGEYQGILDKDLFEWASMFPHIDLQIEILKSINWLKSNPSKARKKNWRKYLSGWLSRANEGKENKKAFRVASQGHSQDRRTKNMDGTPIKSRAEELF